MPNTSGILSTLVRILVLMLCVKSDFLFAGTVSSPDVGVSVSVAGPQCSVWTGAQPTTSTTLNGNTSTTSQNIQLPTVSSPAMSVASYLSTNGITTAPVASPAGWYTSSLLNQTATIQCDTAETIISSFVVRPDPARAVIFQSQAAEQYLVDGPSSSTKAANGDLLMMFEQVAVNGQSKPFAYWNPGGPSANVGYTGVQTGSIQSGYSYATVVWRPVLCCSGYSTPIGQPGTGNAWYAYAEIAIAF